MQSSSTACESLDLINSTSAKPVNDGLSESVTDSSQPATSNCSRETSRSGCVAATKHSTTASCGETNPREIVARIYREELQKLAATAKTTGNFAECVMYEGELERLSQSAAVASDSEPLPAVAAPTPTRKRKDGRHSGSSKRSAATAVDRRTTPQTVLWCAVENPIVDHPEDLTTRSSQSRVQAEKRRDVDITSSQSGITVPQLVHCTPDVNCVGTDLTLSADLCLPAAVSNVTQPEHAVIVKSEELSGDADADVQQIPFSADSDCSPLDLMRTIADSVTSKSHKRSASAEISRYALPPITSEQLKRCSYLNTDEVVTAVRSTLADYSISQRLFGEAVLGLSQASNVILRYLLSVFIHSFESVLCALFRSMWALEIPLPFISSLSHLFFYLLVSFTFFFLASFIFLLFHPFPC